MSGCNGGFGIKVGRVGVTGSMCEGRLALGKRGDFISFVGRGTGGGNGFLG